VTAYVMLYGVGWTQRWQVAEEAVPMAKAEIERVGRNETSHLPVLDPGTSRPTTLVVAWQHVAAAVVLDSGHVDTAADTEPTWPYR
jgi:hypothetical protein